jgi:hypothetical protein
MTRPKGKTTLEIRSVLQKMRVIWQDDIEDLPSLSKESRDQVQDHIENSPSPTEHSRYWVQLSRTPPRENWRMLEREKAE